MEYRFRTGSRQNVSLFPLPPFPLPSSLFTWIEIIFSQTESKFKKKFMITCMSPPFSGQDFRK
jgi:hypothetical protein